MKKWDGNVLEFSRTYLLHETHGEQIFEWFIGKMNGEKSNFIAGNFTSSLNSVEIHHFYGLRINILSPGIIRTEYKEKEKFIKWQETVRDVLKFVMMDGNPAGRITQFRFGFCFVLFLRCAVGASV